MGCLLNVSFFDTSGNGVIDLNGNVILFNT